ncbi:substrate-binding periplasmic protein [Terasakiella pusilla]|uniref:substrate-binding periplasmic protein n=1 Tax=Terasakiella pusilla TaxID=64973 RepID=UPI003AA7C9A5
MKWSILLFSICCICFGRDIYACTLIMGYRTTSRPPYIEAAPNNSGIYNDLYSLAANKIGCTLEIVRLPKKRILLAILNGEIDFYPGFTFTKPRSEYAFFFKNGLYTQMVGLSLKDMPEVHSLEDIRGKVFLRPLGGPEVNAQKYGFIIHKVPELTYDTTFKMLQAGHADFFMDHYVNLKFYLKDHPSKDTMRFHMNCCGEKEPFLVGFSRKSRHYQEEPNPDFDSSIAISPNNFPVRLKTDSTAYRFQQMLAHLEQSGITDKLSHTYFEN